LRCSSQSEFHARSHRPLPCLRRNVDGRLSPLRASADATNSQLRPQPAAIARCPPNPSSPRRLRATHAGSACQLNQRNAVPHLARPIRHFRRYPLPLTLNRDREGVATNREVSRAHHVVWHMYNSGTREQMQRLSMSAAGSARDGSGSGSGSPRSGLISAKSRRAEPNNRRASNKSRLQVITPGKSSRCA